MKTNETNPVNVFNKDGEKVQLTPAELELTRIKREEEKLAKEKLTLQRKATEEKEIVNIQSQMVKDERSQIQLNLAADALLDELRKLDKAYVMEESETVKEYELYHYIISKEDRIDSGKDKDVYFSEKQTLIIKKIKHTLTKSVIIPKHYWVDKSGLRFHSSMWYEGIRYRLDIPGIYDRKNESLKSAKTINEKIQNKYQSNKRKADDFQIKQNGTLWLLDALNVKYPTATITEEQHAGTYYGFGSRRHYSEGAKYVKVKFTNGFELQYGWKKEDDKFEVILHSIVTNGLTPEDQQKVIDLFSK
jgi:hypothetical protein